MEGVHNQSHKRNPRGQHYVSRFYLEGFSDRSSSGGKPIIWVYEKGHPIRPSTLRNEAKRRDYYVFRREGENQFGFEHALDNIETRAARAFQRFQKNHCIICAEDRRIIAQFVGLTFARVPAHRDYINQIFAACFEDEKRKLASDRGLLSLILEDMEQESGRRIDRAQVEEDLRKSDYKAVPSTSFNLYYVAYVADQIADAVFEKRWQVVRATKSQRFITSDNPIVTMRTDPKRGLAQIGVGFGRKEALIFFPLTRDACLAITTEGNVDIRPSSSRIRDINKAIMRVAKRFIYASESSHSLDGVFQKIGCALVYGIDAFVSSKLDRGQRLDQEDC
jgi:hypothetical protein